MPGFTSVELEETGEPGARAQGTINNGYKWTLEPTRWSRGWARRDVTIRTNGWQATMCHSAAEVNDLLLIRKAVKQRYVMCNVGSMPVFQFNVIRPRYLLICDTDVANDTLKSLLKVKVLGCHNSLQIHTVMCAISKSIETSDIRLEESSYRLLWSRYRYLSWHTLHCQ